MSTDGTRGRPPSSRWSVLRALLLEPGPVTQRALSERLEITQQSVSRILPTLAEVVARSSGGWQLADRDRALTLWLQSYRGPGGHSTWWYGLDAPNVQSEQAATLASTLGVAPLISGDTAADRYAPWRTPRTARLYVREPIDLSSAGFVPDLTPSATLELVVPKDRSLWGTSVILDSRRYSDPLMVLWELVHRSDATDAPEAAEHLVNTLPGLVG
ncbi:helix-turn-helix domain-containing protein [Tersicoccus sp. MR15.9]|uniref:helix-turn-helix domain-containing protein n=1 Tax=Tersicoccus mangrovi TaxID=3121635 RepID=UPI002FE53D64